MAKKGGAVSLDIQKPILKGHLHKQNHDKRFFTKRFFVLYQHYLVYYAHEADYNKDRARNSLQHRHGAYYLEGVYLCHAEKKPQGAKYCFIMHIPDKKNCRSQVLLNAFTQEDRKTWMRMIQEMNPNLVCHEGRRQHHRSSEGHIASDSYLAPPRCHQRKASYGGEGELELQQDNDSDEEHSTTCSELDTVATSTKNDTTPKEDTSTGADAATVKENDATSTGNDATSTENNETSTENSATGMQNDATPTQNNATPIQEPMQKLHLSNSH